LKWDRKIKEDVTGKESSCFDIKNHKLASVDDSALYNNVHLTAINMHPPELKPIK
jgi:hypothetical protein